MLASLSGLGMAASALPHAFGAWPSLERRLLAQGVEAGLIETLAAGWFLGTALMLASAALVLGAVVRSRRDGAGVLAALWPLAVAWTGYGLSAFFWRDFATHYLGFIACGVLLGLALSLRPRRGAHPGGPAP